jgi:hypothetical protein
LIKELFLYGVGIKPHSKGLWLARFDENREGKRMVTSSTVKLEVDYVSGGIEKT